ncbi:MAG: hypothetical protein MZV64_19580 [Ignavibacteriales bacterium]|nr:hypothetical protein [Ignavibacteriales bacterium]
MLRCLHTRKRLWAATGWYVHPRSAPPRMCRVERLAGALQQRLDDMVRVEAAQLTAEIEQEVHLLQAAARFIEQGDVLQDDGGLPGDLMIYLKILVCERRHRFGADRHHRRNRALVDLDRQTDHRLRPKGSQQRGIAPFEIFIQG